MVDTSKRDEIRLIADSTKGSEIQKTRLSVIVSSDEMGKAGRGGNRSIACGSTGTADKKIGCAQNQTAEAISEVLLEMFGRV